MKILRDSAKKHTPLLATTKRSQQFSMQNATVLSKVNGFINSGGNFSLGYMGKMDNPYSFPAHVCPTAHSTPSHGHSLELVFMKRFIVFI